MRTYLLIGALLTHYALILTSCTSTRPTFPPQRELTRTSSFETAKTALRQVRIAEYKEVWEDELAGPFAHALAAFRLAQETSDPAWSSEAIKRFKAIVEAAEDHPRARAYLGASHALAARDFPIKGVLQIIPGPGFVRLYHVQQAFSHLNAAVKAAPTAPVIRLIRAATFLGMPKFFGGHEPGKADFALINRWISHEEPNPDHRQVIDSPSYQQEVWLAYACLLDRLGQPEEAVVYWQRVAQRNPNPDVVELAQWRLK
ncbi:hypothetical protein NKDENANG_03818 [Candidatus Entotheonellaceae bacterium PAL068K]